VQSELDLIKSLAVKTPSRIVLLVMDGVGDIPVEELGGKTPLEAARTPHLDTLAARSALGLLDPVLPGVTPGSGPGHTALFGYEPVDHLVGRGVLEGLGIGFDFTSRDVAARFNFATLDEGGRVTDRRAGRIDSECAAELCARLQEAISSIGAAEVIVRPVKEHRGVVVFRGDGLGADLPDTDPQSTGVAPLAPQGVDGPSRATASIAAQFLERAGVILRDEERANTLLLRGFAKYDPLPAYEDVFKLRAAAIAVYPMYRGLAKLAGMEIVEAGSTTADQARALGKAWEGFEYFFVHVKKTDSYGEDGNWKAKLAVIEEVDRDLVPAVLDLGPDVLVVTGDHSTPCALASHSWHPVPVLLHAANSRRDGIEAFGETACAGGSLGRFRGRHLMPVMMGHAGKLKKFGA
jgi:2,3-bisphosphoglycerate-independent phosphoglycerate mutase